jgi:hypothetical protein
MQCGTVVLSPVPIIGNQCIVEGKLLEVRK